MGFKWKVQQLLGLCTGNEVQLLPGESAWEWRQKSMVRPGGVGADPGFRMEGCKFVKIILKFIVELNSGAFYFRHYLLCLLIT